MGNKRASFFVTESEPSVSRISNTSDTSKSFMRSVTSSATGMSLMRSRRKVPDIARTILCVEIVSLFLQIILQFETLWKSWIKSIFLIVIILDKDIQDSQFTYY